MYKLLIFIFLFFNLIYSGIEYNFENNQSSFYTLKYYHQATKSIKYSLDKQKNHSSQTIGNWQPSFSYYVFIPFYSKVVFQIKRLNKFIIFDIGFILFGWQIIRGLRSTRKNIFLIYRSLLAIKIPDPNLIILSSRAHPPTV